MAKRWLWAILAVAMLLLTQAAWAQTGFYDVEDLQPGMKGVGKTCFQGSKPEEFQVEILGVLRGVSPGTDAILARLSGSQLDRTGVFEGMSGSPVFIDGKLLGAIAFSFSFSKETIAGIIPIKQMVGAFTEAGDPSWGPAAILKKSTLWEHHLQTPGDTDNFRVLAKIPYHEQSQLSSAFMGSHSLVPIATPVSLAGFSPRTLQVFTPEFQAMGLSILQGIGKAGLKANTATSTDTLEPGSNLIVSLVRGDLDVSAGGTVTYIDGDRLYAFGHSLLNLGFTELPMHNGRTITVFPSLQSSFKILEIGDPIGAVRQDRGTGIFGIIGQRPTMVPLRTRLTTSRGAKKNLNYEIVRDRYLTGVLINLTVYNTIVASERVAGVQTLKVKGRISIKGENPVEIENRFSSDSDALARASLSIAAPVEFLMTAGYQHLEIENIDLDISVQENDRSALLDSIRSDRTELRAGETINIDISYKKTNGEVLKDSYPVKIPEGISPGPLTMLVADGTRIMAIETQEHGDELIPRDLSQLIKFINNIRRNDRLYVRFYRQEPGAVVRGEGMPGLPPSILSILKSVRNTGGMIPINTSPFREYQLPETDYIVSGSKALTLLIKS